LKAYIGAGIVDAAMSAFRGIARASDPITPRQTSRPPAAPKAVMPPVVIEISLIRVVINLGR
jgi:hypothetical protein